MPDVKLQLGIKFLDKDIEVSAITKQVQLAINRAIAQVDLSSLKAKIVELQKLGAVAPGGAKATKSIQDQSKALDAAAQSSSRVADATNKLAAAKSKSAGISAVSRNEVRLVTQDEARIRELENAFSKAGVTAAGFGARIGEIAKRFSGFFVYTIALFKFLEALRFTAEQMELLNRTSANLAKVLKNNTSREIESAKDSLIGLAVETRRSFDEVATAAQGFVRQGLTLNDALAATTATMELLNVSLIDSATAQKLVTTLMQSMGLSAEEAAQKINVFSVVADNSASTVEDLAAGFSRAGSTARAFNIRTEELAAAVGTVVAVTQLSATRVGTAFKTILSYTAANKAALLDLAAGYQGINKTTAELVTEHENVIDVLRFVAQGWDDLDSAQKTAIGRLVGGKRRFNELAALLGNITKFEDLLAKSIDETDAVRRKSQIEVQTLAAAHRELGAAITGFARILEQAGLIEFYRQLVLGISGTIQIITQFIGVTTQLGDALRDKYELKIDTEGAAAGLNQVVTDADALAGGLVEGFANAIDGAKLLRNTLLVLFTRLLLPKIAEASKAFSAFITGSITQMQELIGVERNRIRIIGETTAQYQAQRKAIVDVNRQVQQLNISEKGRFGIGTKATTTAPAVAPRRERGLGIVGTVALLQAVDSASAGLSKFAENLDAASDSVLQSSAKTVASLAQTSAPFFLFSKNAGIASLAIGAFGIAVDEVSKTISALNARSEAIATFTQTRVNAEQLLIAAQQDELVALGLVAKGFAKFENIVSETGRTLGKKLVIDFEALPEQVDVELLRGAALGDLQRQVDEVTIATAKLSSEWAIAQEEIEKAGKLAEAFRRTTDKIAKQRIQFSLDVARTDLPNAAEAFEAFSTQIDEFSAKDVSIKFNIDYAQAQRGSAALYQLDNAIKRAEAGSSTLDEALADWTKTFTVSTPEIERSATKLQEMKDRADELRDKIKELIQTSENYKPGNLDIRVEGAQKFGDIFKQIRENVIAFRKVGIEPSEQSVDKLVDRLKEAARLSGEDLPEGTRKHIKEIIKSGNAYEYISDRQKLITKLGLEHVKVLREIPKILEESANVRKVLSDQQEKHNDLVEKQKQQTAEGVINLRQQLELVKERNKVVERQLQLQEESRTNELELSQALDRQRIVSAILGQQESIITKARREAAATIEANRIGIEKAITAAKELYATELQRAKDRGLTEQDIQPLTQTIALDIEGKIGDITQQNIEALSDLIQTRIKEIENLEKARFDSVKDEINEIANLEQKRADAARSVTEGLIDALSAGGLSDVDISNIIDTGGIRAQLSQVDDSIKRSLNLKAKLELAASLESIDIEFRKQEQILRYQRQQAVAENDTAQQAIISSRLRQNASQKLHDRAIAIAEAMRSSVVRNFELMSEGTQAATEKLREIADVEKEIARLRAQVNFTPPEDLATQAARRDTLEARRDELALRAEELQAFVEHNQALEAQAQALEDAKNNADEYRISIKRQLGLTSELTNAFGRVAIASETAANILFSTEDSILRVRTENAQASLQVYQDQLNKLRSLGEQLYTARPSEVLKLAQANTILENSTTDIATTLSQLPFFLRDAAAQIVRLRFGEAGQTLISEAGLARLGVPGEELADLQQKVLNQANVIAQDQIKQVEEQQRTSDGVNAGVALLERQIAQTERNIQASEDAAQKIEEMRDAVVSQDNTPKAQLKEAIERRKLLRGQLAFQQQQLQSNLAQFGVVGPSLQSIDANNREQINILKQSDDSLRVLRQSMGDAAASLAEIASAGLREINVQLDQAAVPALDTENLGQQIFANSQVVSELTDGIRNVGNEIIALQSQQNELRSTYEHVREVIEDDIGLLPEALTSASEVIRNSTEALATQLQEGGTQAEVLAVTEASAQSLNEIKAFNDSMVQLLNDANVNYESINQGVASTKESVESLGAGQTLQSVVNAINDVTSAVNALDVKINVNVTKVVNQYSGGTNAAGGLSDIEKHQVIAAAMREKSRKPTNSDLIVANSSELVMTPEQAAKIFGQINMTDKRGNLKGAPMIIEKSSRISRAGNTEGAENVASLIKRVDNLIDQQSDLISLAKDKKLFTKQQNIKIDVAGKREVTVKGVAEFGKAVEDIFRKNMEKMPTRAEQRALESILKNIIKRIRDAGIDGIYGV
jgi:TP901 family phage tail tape measure protein